MAGLNIRWWHWLPFRRMSCVGAVESAGREFLQNCQKVRQLLSLPKVASSGLLSIVHAKVATAFFLIWIVHGARHGP